MTICHLQVRLQKQLKLLEQEYDGGIPNARVMLEKCYNPRVLEYKDKISEVDGVSNITWLDSVADITVPLETLDEDTVETYYKDGNALLSVTIDEDKKHSSGRRYTRYNRR